MHFWSGWRPGRRTRGLAGRSGVALAAPLLVWCGRVSAEVHRVRSQGSSSAALRADDEVAVAHLAAGDVARLRVLPLHTDHHQHRSARHEGLTSARTTTLIIRQSNLTKDVTPPHMDGTVFPILYNGLPDPPAPNCPFL